MWGKIKKRGKEEGERLTDGQTGRDRVGEGEEYRTGMEKMGGETKRESKRRGGRKGM